MNQELLQIAIDLMGEENPLMEDLRSPSDIMMRAKLAIPEFPAILSTQNKLDDTNARIAGLLVDQADLATLRAERKRLELMKMGQIADAYRARSKKA